MKCDLSDFEKFIYLLPNADSIEVHECITESGDDTTYFAGQVVIVPNSRGNTKSMKVSWKLLNSSIIDHKIKIHSIYHNFLLSEVVNYLTHNVVEYKAQFKLPDSKAIDILYVSAFNAAFDKDLEDALSE